MDCIFCKIARKEINSAVVFETETVIVIKDINPQAPTHLLIIPKAHYPTLNDCADPTLLADMLIAAKDAAARLGVAERGYRLTINTNKEGGQTVFHLHLHLMAGRALTEKMC